MNRLVVIVAVVGLFLYCSARGWSATPTATPTATTKPTPTPVPTPQCAVNQVDEIGLTPLN